VPYAGGEIDLFGSKRSRVLSTNDTVELWLKRNGCDLSQEPDRENIDRADDKTSVEKRTWAKGCPHAPVLLYRIEGGGHTWPSGGQYLPVSLVGKTTRDIDGAVEAWGFFQTFR
jgi:polyhydroxybutyrate depolymerase